MAGGVSYNSGKHTKEANSEVWKQVGARMLINALTHPMDYAKVLMQIGHEPIAPKPTKTLFGKPALALPSLFQYIGYIKSVDGTAGCFRGISAKICFNFVNGFTLLHLKEHLAVEEIDKEDELDDVLEDDSDRKRKFAHSFVVDLVCHTSAVVVSHPFQVIGIRMMSEFVGGENKYSSLFGSFMEVYRHDGLAGFFTGLFPRLIGDLLTVCITTSCAFLIHFYCTKDEEVRNYSSAIVGFFATAFTYPFHLVSNCMIVNKSGLAAGSPPHMINYDSWLHCWSHLKSTNQIKRGSSLLWRYYTGPFIMVNDKPVVVAKDNFVPASKLRLS